MDTSLQIAQASLQLTQVTEFVFMLIVDMMFLVVLVLMMLPLGIWRQAAFAVMKRNFIGYFSNPTGYVFLCLFVLLTSFAAFWPHEFFTTNLANFDQLNTYLPYIMLIFIPAITMSIWAEEKRHGTDELLLTLPAKDFDIVIGKYFAAVLVFTVSLLFSQLSNYAVLLAMTGGQLDNLLLFSTYLGYWFMGVSMIALGMVASFLTSNLTVGFIFGAALNAPLAFFSNADVIFSNSAWIQRLFEWSLLQRFEPFGRGLISAPSICYFIGIIVVGVYLSLILIGRRHWLGGRDGTSYLWHYLVRAGCLAVTMVAAVLIVQYSPLNRLRVDISDAKVSTLAPVTTELLEALSAEGNEGKPPIKIEAYVGASVPSEYVKIKYDLVNLLREFDVLGGSRIQVNLHQGVEPFSEEAILAEKKYGIRPVKVMSQSRGALREEDVILGVAFSSGLERIVLPFMPYGIPVEYELMRSINTVSQPERKTIGVVQTDAMIMGATVNTGQELARIPRLRLLTEIEKQYNVEQVDASTPISMWIEDGEGNPIKRRYDVLLLVQPSLTTPAEMDNIIKAIQLGQPTAIFEDPLPSPENFNYIPPTYMPRLFARNGGEKAVIQNLWDAIDLDVDHKPIARPTTVNPNQRVAEKDGFIVWQMSSNNPYPRNSILNQRERLIVSDGQGYFSPEHPATSGVNELYFQYSGYLQPTPSASLEFEKLVETNFAGRVKVSNIMNRQNDQFGSANRQFTLAAYIHGNEVDKGVPTKEAAGVASKQKTDVIYVADIDTLSDFYVSMRETPIVDGVEYRYQNMSFVLNVIDALADEQIYLGLRNRKVDHVTLAVVEKTYESAMQRVFDLDQQLQIEYTTNMNKAESDIKAKLKPTEDEIQKELRKKNSNQYYDAAKLAAKQRLLEQQVRDLQEKYKNKQLEFENERSDKKRRIDLDAELEIQEIQRQFKLAAVILPPIPPMLVGLIVFTRRRLREREGISKARRLK